VDLIEGKPLEIEQKLKSSLRYGQINLNIEESWAYVYLNGKKVGQAPGTFRLPVGAQTLVLKNPESKKSKSFKVTVTEGKKQTYTTRL
jgi:hypothetical protein